MQNSLPQHLRKYVAPQEEYQYTSIEHSTWRYIMNRLTTFLKDHAHESYVEGLTKTGIRLDRIPSIADISKHLEPYGWRAVPVSGFIPPTAFMELQALGVLPIAREMRTPEHLEYTPAPDIVHEAAGHAPLLVHPEYSAYLREYANLARRAIMAKSDLAVYHAIRKLSDLKENPLVTPNELARAEAELEEALLSHQIPSEATWLARMNWWTAEYGLIGDIRRPRIYGAGLLSSVGESQSCLSEQVKKLPLTLDCIHVPYDITEPQPQLFVTPDFEHLRRVLEDLKAQMSFIQGGVTALSRALLAERVCAFRWDSGIEISGVLKEVLFDGRRNVAFVRFSGPVQLSHQEKVLLGQGVERHGHGFSAPLGPLVGNSVLPYLWSLRDWRNYLGFDLAVGKKVQLRYASGFELQGELKALTPHPEEGHRPFILTFINCELKRGSEVFFQPSWGEFDLIFAHHLASAWGGPADSSSYPLDEDYYAIRVQKGMSPSQQQLLPYFNEIEQLRSYPSGDPRRIQGVTHLQQRLTQAGIRHALLDWEIRQLLG
jgi:phenylalanine-4-hydroxylase